MTVRRPTSASPPLALPQSWTIPLLRAARESISVHPGAFIEGVRNIPRATTSGSSVDHVVLTALLWVVEDVTKALVFVIVVEPRANRRTARCTSIARRRVWEPRHLHERRLCERRECGFQRTEDRRVARTPRVTLLIAATPLNPRVCAIFTPASFSFLPARIRLQIRP